MINYNFKCYTLYDTGMTMVGLTHTDDMERARALALSQTGMTLGAGSE